MKNVLKSVVATALCAVSLCAMTAPRAHAAAAKVVFSGQIQDSFDLNIVGVDGANNVNLDDLTQQLTDQFTGSKWDVMDNKTVVLTKDGKAISGLPSSLPYLISSKDLSVTIPHILAKDGSGMDGRVIRYSDDPTSGFVWIFGTMPIKGGGVVTYWLNAPLTFGG